MKYSNNLFWQQEPQFKSPRSQISLSVMFDVNVNIRFCLRDFMNCSAATLLAHWIIA